MIIITIIMIFIDLGYFLANESDDSDLGIRLEKNEDDEDNIE